MNRRDMLKRAMLLSISGLCSGAGSASLSELNHQPEILEIGIPTIDVSLFGGLHAGSMVGFVIDCSIFSFHENLEIINQLFGRHPGKFRLIHDIPANPVFEQLQRCRTEAKDDNEISVWISIDGTSSEIDWHVSKYSEAFRRSDVVIKLFHKKIRQFPHLHYCSSWWDVSLLKNRYGNLRPRTRPASTVITSDGKLKEYVAIQISPDKDGIDIFSTPIICLGDALNHAQTCEYAKLIRVYPQMCIEKLYLGEKVDPICGWYKLPTGRWAQFDMRDPIAQFIRTC